jgi:hypothetical protein
MATTHGAATHILGYRLEVKDADTQAGNLLGKLRDHRDARFIATTALRKRVATPASIHARIEDLFSGHMLT